MKKITAYLLGILTGAILTIVVLLVIGLDSNVPGASSGNMDGLSTRTESGEPMDFKSVRVFQVLTDGMALANGRDESASLEIYSGPVVMLMSIDQKFHDDQIIKTAPDEQFVRIGEYKYKTGGGLDKTVPAIEIRKK